MKLLFLFLLVKLCMATTWQADSVHQYGITWYFDQAYTVGTFANGDYWVVGPVQIDSITPHFDGDDNGWEVNPVVAGGQGFQKGCAGDSFDSTLIPSLPYISPVSGIVSIVKTIVINPWGNRPCIQVAAVLTVVDTIPPNEGSNVFRPPYVASTKTYYYIDSLKTDLLPSFSSIGSPPSVQTIADRFRKLRLDHKSGLIGRAIRPADAMDNYQPKNTEDINNSVLSFMLDTPIDTIMPALIQYVQAGIDKIYTILDGQRWPAGGGHQPGHIVMTSFTATLLDITQAKSFLNNADTLSIANAIHASRFLPLQNPSGKNLWGEVTTEAGYWGYVMRKTGSQSQADPYVFIDGAVPGTAYQEITAQSHKGEVLAATLMPILQQAWPAQNLAYARNYAERWVSLGVWSQPDPCAPFCGDTLNYGVTFGPDPLNPGMCIKDTNLLYYNSPSDFAYPEGETGGRFPERHATLTDSGQYKSQFVAAMWDEYYYSMLFSIDSLSNVWPQFPNWYYLFYTPVTIYGKNLGDSGKVFLSSTLIDSINVWSSDSVKFTLNDTAPIGLHTLRFLPFGRDTVTVDTVRIFKPRWRP